MMGIRLELDEADVDDISLIKAAAAACRHVDRDQDLFVAAVRASLNDLYASGVNDLNAITWEQWNRLFRVFLGSYLSTAGKRMFGVFFRVYSAQVAIDQCFGGSPVVVVTDKGDEVPF